jgi:tight adherence protein C
MDVIIISLFIGGLCALVVWNIYRLFAEVPMEDRSYLDRPALGFRLFWPLIKTLDFYCAGLFSDSYKEKVSAKLVRAGQGYMLSASQFLAARIFSALLVCLLVGAYAALAQKPALWGVALSAALLASFYPELWLKETQQKRDKRVTKDLPFYLDVIVLAVESGTNFTGGLTQAVQKAPDGP